MNEINDHIFQSLSLLIQGCIDLIFFENQLGYMAQEF